MIRRALQNFMYGRYGTDQLNIALLVLYLVLYLVSALVRLEVLYWLSLVVLFFLLFRTLSRNASRRRAENAKFLQVAGPLLRWIRFQRTAHRDKEHRYLCGLHNNTGTGNCIPPWA